MRLDWASEQGDMAALVAAQGLVDSVEDIRNLGYGVDSIVRIPLDQSAFAVPTDEVDIEIDEDVRFRARPLPLPDGRFTNCYEVSWQAGAGYELVPGLVAQPVTLLQAADDQGSAVTATGTFEFISDDPSYAPVERCFDLAVRNSQLASLPTASRWALVREQGRPATIEWVEAEGTLRVQDRDHTWRGSKVDDVARRRQVAGAEPALTVFGAANCSIVYAQAAGLPFTRSVERSANVTPLDDGSVDVVVAGQGDQMHVHRVVEGGGADLFEGAFILRVPRAHRDSFGIRAPLTITAIGALDLPRVTSAFSIGPSVAEATTGHPGGLDGCIGASPFGTARHARVTVSLLPSGSGSIRVFDGAPAVDRFQGVTVDELAACLTSLGDDPEAVFLMDGGQSSRLVLRFADGISTYGSLHYCKWPSPGDPSVRWAGQIGRPCHSALHLRRSRERKREGEPGERA